MICVMFEYPDKVKNDLDEPMKSAYIAPKPIHGAKYSMQRPISAYIFEIYDNSTEPIFNDNVLESWFWNDIINTLCPQNNKITFETKKLKQKFDI